MSNLTRLLQRLGNQNSSVAGSHVADVAEDEVVEEVPERVAFFFDCNHLYAHQHYQGMMVALPGYDAEAKEKIFSRLNTANRKSWTYCPGVGKKGLLQDHPQMTGAWRCLTSDDYETWKQNVEDEFSDLDDSRYTFQDKGCMPLCTFFSREKIALDIAKDPAACQDDNYYFGGMPGARDDIDKLIGEYEQLIVDANKPSPHTPPKKKRRSS